MLGFLAFGLSACDKVGEVWESVSQSTKDLFGSSGSCIKTDAWDSISLPQNECQSEEDKISGCVQYNHGSFDAFSGGFGLQTFYYKNGEVIAHKESIIKVGEAGRMLSKRYIEKVGDTKIFHIFIPTDNDENNTEEHCVGVIEDDIYGCVQSTEHTSLRKNWRDGDIYENCEYNDNLGGTKYINGVCETDYSGSTKCFKNGKSYECNEKEKAKLLAQDCSDFYKRCVRRDKNGGGFEIYPASCEI